MQQFSGWTLALFISCSKNRSHWCSLTKLQLALFFPASSPSSEVTLYVTGMQKILWPSFSIITKCWTCKNGKMSLKMSTPSTSLRHMAGMKSTNLGKVFARERDVHAFLIYSCCSRPLSTCLHLILAFACSLGALHGGPLPHVPLGTLSNGIMRKLSVRQREWKRLVSVWLKSLMRYVLGFLSNSKSGIIADQVVTFGCWTRLNGHITVCLIMLRLKIVRRSLWEMFQITCKILIFLMFPTWK